MLSNLIMYTQPLGNCEALYLGSNTRPENAQFNNANLLYSKAFVQPWSSLCPQVTKEMYIYKVLGFKGFTP